MRNKWTWIALAGVFPVTYYGTYLVGWWKGFAEAIEEYGDNPGEEL